ncbi:hypothetical protein PISMIDRAFT_690384, partial [Pisolithus microcarpus 441]
HKRFTGTCNKEEFHLACGTIELRGAEALELMHALIGEMVVGHDDLERKWRPEGIGNHEDR